MGDQSDLEAFASLHLKVTLNGWMGDLRFSTVFQSYQDDGRVIIMVDV